MCAEANSLELDGDGEYGKKESRILWFQMASSVFKEKGESVFELL